MKTKAGLQYHELMIGNFDQVWSVLFRPKRTTLVKREAQHDQLSRSIALRKLRHCLERSLDMPLTEAFGDKESHVKPPRIQGGNAACVAVDQWRVPRTLCTLSWINGDMGRGFVTVRDDTLTEEQRLQANQARTHLECVIETNLYIYNLCIYNIK